MAYQKPIVLEIKDNIIRIKNPDLTNPKFKTYLTDGEAAAATIEIGVADNKAMLDKDNILYGKYGEDGAEIKAIAVTIAANGLSFTTVALTFAHAKNTPLTYIEWDEIEIIGATTSGAIVAGTGTVLNIASAEVLITPNKEYTEYHLSASEITTYTYFGARWHNSAAAAPYFSAYSEEYTNTAQAYNSVAEIKKDALNLIGAEEEEGTVTDSAKLLSDINNCTRFIQGFKKKWSWELTNKASDTLATVTQTVTDPTDVKDPNTGISYERLWISGSNALEFLSLADYREKTKSWITTTLGAAISAITDTSITLTDSSDFASAGSINIEGDSISYTANNTTTNVLSGVTDITSTHSNGATVWQNISDGEPSHYAIYNGSIYLYPLPNSSVNGKILHIDYYKTLTALDSNLDTITSGFPLVYQYYITSMIKRRQGEKTEAKEWWQDFKNELTRESDEDIVPSGSKVTFIV